MDRVYLDWAATAPADIESQRTALETSFVYPGNPSSVHTEGKRARQKLEEIRTELGNLLNWPSDGICFTSGGTESNNIVISSMLKKRGKVQIMSSLIEHPSITSALSSYSGYDVSYMQPDKTGFINPEQIHTDKKNVKLINLMYVNNEIGTVQNIPSAVTYKPKGAHFHSDIVQALGKIPLQLDNVDSVSISAHKLGGPKGCGLLLLRKSIDPLYRGGDQEGGIRPGTESIFNAMCMLEVVRKSLDGMHETISHGKYIKKYLVEELLTTDGVQLIPGFTDSTEYLDAEKYSPFILRCSIPPLPGEVIIRMLDDNGIAASTGSACSSRKKNNNTVLEAIGVDSKIAESSIRISWGKTTRLADVQYLIKIIREKILPAASAIK